ncbi:MAG: HNH endonuclease [Gammaproteobacteria bacterium]
MDSIVSDMDLDSVFIEEHVQPIPDSGCWLWDDSEATHNQRENGQSETPFDVFVYKALSGPIPAGYHIVHKCRVWCCVNPDHMTVQPESIKITDD